MPITKQYLRYEHACMFGVACSKKSNVLLLKDHGSSKVTRYRAVCPALEDVNVWSTWTNEKLKHFKGEKKSEVTALALSADEQTLAVGYHDGVISLWSMETESVIISFNGHRKAVTCLRFSGDGLMLVSGGADTDVIVWDVVVQSGLFRLKGHTGPVTHGVFARTANMIVTSSKDTLIKFWDLDTKTCVHTVVGHRSEVWSFVLLREETRLLTGSAACELRFYDLDMTRPPEHLPLGTKRSSSSSEAECGVKCEMIGTLKRSSHESVVGMAIDPDETCLVISSGSNLEPFLLRSEKELEEIGKKRAKKAAKKSKKTGETVAPQPITLEDQILKIRPLRASSKIRGLDVQKDKNGQLTVLVALAANSLELWGLAFQDNLTADATVRPLHIPAHASSVRAVAFSSDDACLASGCSEQLRVWSRESQHCLLSLATGYVLCLAFAPGNRHLFVGFKSGTVELYDVAAGRLLESIEAHSGPVWALDMTHDKRGFVTGSADRLVKFWEFDLNSVTEGPVTRKVLTAAHVKTLQMAEDVLCVKSSANQRYLAVSLLDSTVKILFWDTLKFFLSLYGHHFPVLCMDISSDNTLIVTGSQDKNIKIWGMDHGDCHKSIFAHDGSIMTLQFVPGTHLLFSGGKDKKLKCWDADTFEHISTLEGHQGEVLTLAVSHDGDTVVSGSHDNSLRLWERTDEPLVLSEEQELEREREGEEMSARTFEPVIPGETNQEVAIAGRKTVETVIAADRIIEAIDIYREESGKMADHRARCELAKKELPAPNPHPILMAYGNPTPEKYVLNELKKVRSSELDESLLVLPFLYVVDLLSLLKYWLQEGWEVALCARCVFFLLKVHHKQIVTTKSLLGCLGDLKDLVLQRIGGLKDTAGFNLAAMQLLQREMRQRGVHVFEDTSVKGRRRAKS